MEHARPALPQSIVSSMREGAIRNSNKYRDYNTHTETETGNTFSIVGWGGIELLFRGLASFRSLHLRFVVNGLFVRVCLIFREFCVSGTTWRGSGQDNWIKIITVHCATLLLLKRGEEK